MRKLIQYNLLVLGLVLLVYSVAAPIAEIKEATEFIQMGLSSTIIQESKEYSFLENWKENYRILTVIGGILTAVAVLLLKVFRTNRSTTGTATAVLISCGIMLGCSSFVQAWDYAVHDVSLYLPELWMSTPVAKPFSVSLADGLMDGLWMVLLGLVLIIAGVVAWRMEQRKTKEEPVTEVIEAEEPEKEEVTPVYLEREEWRFTLFCTVMDIRGDYALVKYDDSGVESEVAIALLPFGIDVGDKLKYENYEFERA